MKRKILFLIMSLAILLLDICWIQIFSWYLENKKQEKMMEEISYTSSSVSSINANYYNPPSDPNDSYYQYVDIPFMQIDFTDLLSQNSDVTGWIRFSSANIDYPFVQTSDNDYYLNHSFDHSISKAGWIFSDFRNNFFALNANTILYGHRRLDGSMFGSLKNVLEENWFTQPENHLIFISTLKENMIFQVVSVYVIPKESYYITTHFKDSSTYQEFLDTILKRSIFSFTSSLNPNDKILTLSTCKDSLGVDRIVVHARLIKKESRQN